MKKIVFTIILISTSILIGKAQQVDASYLNPTAGSGTDYYYLRFGNTSTYYAGLMWNNTNTAYGDGNDFTLFTYDNRDITFRTGTGNVIFFPSAGGNVGIGTSTPAAKLDVIGKIKGNNIQAGTNTQSDGIYATYEPNDIRFNRSNGPSYFRQQGNNALLFTTGASSSQATVLTLYPNQNAKFQNDLYILGNIGVGTINPTGNLEVANSAGATLSITTNKSNGSNAAPKYMNIDFLGYQNGNKARIQSVDVTHDGYGSKLSFFVNNGQASDALEEYLTILHTGNVGIGCTNPGEKLVVDGTIMATKVQIKTSADLPCSDYVFNQNYNLLSLADLEAFIKANKHLPEVPSAEEFKENGYSVGEMDDILLRKVEELTLYLIKKDKEVNKLVKQEEEKDKIIQELTQRIEALENK